MPQPTVKISSNFASTEYDDVGPISWIPSDTCISDTSLTEKIPPLMRELLQGEEIRSSKSRFLRKQKELKLKREHVSPNRSYRKKTLTKKSPDVFSKTPSPRDQTRSRKSLRDDVIYVPLMNPAINGSAMPLPFKSRTNKTANCPLRIMELAEPTKRQCLETWRNKKDILPAYMVERLKKIVTEQKPVATIPDAITCFKIKRPILYKQKQNAIFNIRTKEDAEQLRLMCAQLSLAVAQKFIKPCTLELPYEQKILSSVVANSIKNTMKRGKINHNKKENQKILKDVSDRVTVWIATILEDVKATTLNEELEELREKEGPVFDILDDIIDEALDKCVVESEVTSPQTSEDVFVSISDENEETQLQASKSKSASFEDEAQEESQTVEVQDDDNAKNEEVTTTENSHHEEPSPQPFDIVEETTEKDNKQDTDSQKDADVKTVDLEDEVSRTLAGSRTGGFDRKVKFSPIDGRSRKFDNNITSSPSKNNLDNITFNPPKEELLSDADESWPAEMTYPIYKVSANAGKSIESLGKIIELYKESTPWAVDNPADLYDEYLITDVELLSQQDKTDDDKDDATTGGDRKLIPELSSYQQEMPRRQNDSDDNREQSGKAKPYTYLEIDLQILTSGTTASSYSHETSMVSDKNKRDVASQNVFESSRSQNTEPTNSGNIFDDKTTVTTDGLELVTNATQVDKNKQDLVDTHDVAYAYLDNDLQTLTSGTTASSYSHATSMVSDKNKRDVASQNVFECSRSQNTEPTNSEKIFDDKTSVTTDGLVTNATPVDKNKQDLVDTHDVATENWLGTSRSQNTETIDEGKTLVDKITLIDSGTVLHSQVDKNQQTSVTEKYDVALQSWLGKSTYQNTEPDRRYRHNALMKDMVYSQGGHMSISGVVHVKNLPQRYGFLSALCDNSDMHNKNKNDMNIQSADTTDSDGTRKVICHNMARLFDYKVYEDTAPSWVGRGRGDQNEDLYEKVKQQMTENDIQQWCKNMQNVMTLLDEWNRWIITVAENYITLTKKNENCECRHKRCPTHHKHWAKLKENIDKDVLLWTKLQKKAFAKLQKYNDIVKRQDPFRVFGGSCRCATGKET